MVESKWVRVSLEHFGPFGYTPLSPSFFFQISSLYAPFLCLLHLQAALAISRLLFKSHSCDKMSSSVWLFLCLVLASPPPPPPLPLFPSHYSGVSARLAQSLSEPHNGWVCSGFEALAPRSPRPTSSEPWPSLPQDFMTGLVFSQWTEEG